MLISPATGQVLSDLRFGFSAAPVPQCRESKRIAFPVDDGAHDGHASLAGEVRDRAMDLDVHLVESFLHPLDAAGALGDEVAELALHRA